MGLYIEPKGDKLEWCEQNGELLTESMGYSNIDYNEIPESDVIVCLVDNGMFYAGAIAIDEREFNMFNEPDERNKFWFSIDKEKVKSVSLKYKSYMEK